jgi:hypothetical protein
MRLAPARPEHAPSLREVIAAGIPGRKPTPTQITARLKATARKLGGPQDQALYDAGLLDAGATTTRN